MDTPDRDCLTDEQWSRLAMFMPGGCRGKRGPRTNNRLFVDALLWMARSGGRWRDLPERYGRYPTVKRRYYDWIERGVLGAILQALSEDADLEWLSIDSTVIRAHSQAAGARKEKGGADAQGLGRSRGGLTTKIHAAVEALGNAVRLIGTPGQYSDIGQAEALIEGFGADYVLADRAYDADRFHDATLDSAAIPVVSPMPQRRHQHRYDRSIYKERNRIERFFNKIKQFRRVATRYDKLLANLMGFVSLAAIHIAIR